MVKVAGRRVELDAVEQFLLADEQVGEAVVLARPRRRGTNMLVGYVTAREGTFDPRSLRERLGRTVPAYLVPSRLVVLKAIPRLPNGELDRRALADTPTGIQTPPRNALERRLVEIWQELLELHVGTYDDFFEMGGDSLLAMEMLVEIEESLSCSLTPGTLMKAPTINSLAQIIAGSRAGGRATTQADPIHARSDRPTLFFVYALGGNGLRYRWLAEELGDEFPIQMLEAPWWDGASDEIRTIEQLARHHVVEIRSQQPTGPYMLVGSLIRGLARTGDCPAAG